MTRTSLVIAAALGALSGLFGCVETTTAPGTPSVGSATDLSDFEGARAGQAEPGLQALGFEPIRSEGLVTFWFNRDTGTCARITTSNGRYSDVTMLPAEDC
jgi:hypothetical protein